jgi:hypothetical protein
MKSSGIQWSYLGFLLDVIQHEILGTVRNSYSSTEMFVATEIQGSLNTHKYKQIKKKLFWN